MDLFAPVFAVLLVVVLLLDHAIMNNRIKQLEKEVKLWEHSDR